MRIISAWKALPVLLPMLNLAGGATRRSDATVSVKRLMALARWLTRFMLSWALFQSAYAGVIDTGTQASVCFGTSRSDCPLFYFHTSPLTGAGVSRSGTVVGTRAGESSTYNISTSATFGAMHAYASQTATGNATSGYAEVAAYSWFNDVFTFSSSGKTGNGTAYFTFDVDGRRTASPGTTPSGPFGKAALAYYSGVYPVRQVDGTISVSNTTFAGSFRSEPIPFTFGVGVNVDATIIASGDADCQPRSRPSCIAWTAGTTTDFSATATLSRIELFDSNNSLIPAFSIQSGSGTVYTANGIVPEPGTAAIAGVTLLVIACLWLLQSGAAARRGS